LKKLGFIGAISLVIGNIIGVGIFTTTGYMATYIQSPGWMLFAWLVGAIYALSGAVVYGILSAHYPLSGGDYQYLKKSVNPVTGYLFGWSAFFVTYSGSIAALSIAAAIYLNGIFSALDFNTSLINISLLGIQINLNYIKLIAILIIAAFTWINYRGIVVSGKSQIILTAGIFLLLIFFSLTGTFSSHADYSLLFQDSGTSQDISGFFLALIAVLFAYMGWTTAVYVAEEVQEAKSILPKALIAGVLVVGFIYIWVNLVYLIAVPLSEMKGIVNIGSAVAVTLWGGYGQIMISGLILIAVLSSLNSTILSGPRIYMAMGRDGFFFGRTAKLHKKYDVPHIAIIWQSVWSIILVLTGSFNELLSFVVFIAIIFSIAAAMISIKIYLKNNSLFTPPMTGILFYLIFCILVMINTLWQKPIESLIGLIIVAIAIPFYVWEENRIKGKEDKRRIP
jgi:basic amino acid/polyamine antiporter, APA family